MVPDGVNGDGVPLVVFSQPRQGHQLTDQCLEAVKYKELENKLIVSKIHSQNGSAYLSTQMLNQS